MKSTIVGFSLFTFLLIPIFSACEKKQSFKIATYNIFYYTPEEHPNSWQERRPEIVNLINFHEIVLWGSQEGVHRQLQDLKQDLGHDYVGVGRDDGETEGEHSAIFFDPKLFRVHEHSTFWLSETPDEPSYGWGANYRRICTWGRFEHINTGFEFFVYNVHFDHEVQLARENSIDIVMNHILEHTGELPVMFMGDFNVTPENPVYERALGENIFQDARLASELPPHGPKGTFNGFDINRMPDRRIDYIFLSDHFNVLRYGVLTDQYGLKYPSDHFPVLAEITFNTE